MVDCPTRADAAKLSDEQLLEKLRAFGLEGDRAELERLCEGALSAEDVAWPLLDRCGVAGREGRPNEDWIWLVERGRMLLLRRQPLERLRDATGQTRLSNPSSPETLTVAPAGGGH